MSDAGPHRLPRLAVTLGDPRGIGPEVTAAALARLEPAAGLILVGAESDVILPADVRLEAVGRWTGGSAADAGRIAGLAIERAVALLLDGQADALVTAPIDKAALHAAGYDFPGHTEMLASLTGTRTVGMLMAAEQTVRGGPLRVLLATTHLALARVPGAVTTALLVEQAQLLDGALRDDWGIAEPRLALCALNPHASDGGLFGDEEARVMAPALERLRAAGMDIRGPIPADTVFVRAIAGEFDAVVAPYHDVGMAAFKTAAFGQGVNVTLGLPFPRTSPDHGTAIDIARRGVADPSSMIEALRLGTRLAARRQVAPSFS